jgi:hypothetical protein
MEVDKDEYILEITSDSLEREAESGVGGERSQKGRSDRKEVDRGGFFSEENRQGVACADRDHSQGLWY